MKNKFNIIVKVIMTIIIVTFLSFLLMHLSPVDPAEAYAKRHSAVVTDAQVEEIRIKLGMDKPLLVQYVYWMKDAIRLNFGISLGTGHLVSDEIGKAIPVTLSIVSTAALMMIIGTLIFGCMNYYYKGSVLGRLLNILNIMCISIPPFYIAILFIDIFAVKLEWLNVSGNSGILKFLPSAICLAISGMAFYSQFLADNLQMEMDDDYIMYARCRGLSEWRIIICHALPNAIVNLIPNFMQMLGLCLAGSGIIERVFSLPGIGYLIIDAVINRDSPVIHATILFLAIAIILLDFVATILQQLLQKNRVLQGGR
ncbi:MAG: ABC transporter permease [Clostridium sp.]